MASALERLPAHGLYTVPEAAYVADLDSKAVHNEFEQNVFEASNAERLISRPSLYYFVAVKPFRTHISTEVRRLWHKHFLDAYQKGKPLVELGFFQVPIEKIAQEVAPKLDLLERLRDTIRITKGIAGGEPVIAGTRIKPRLAAQMVQSGTPPEEIVREYGLTEEQIELALLFDRLYPKRGRPRIERRGMKTHALPPR
ncbi:DUF433 domain-containing protein [Azospirillum sp. SYSU D00513]|uniref:DUF433 domain-containing protein n=1 Tax=Azospirillum sp. SYSU D00513 TaxID=2812561 RepID=UPI001A96FF44|nr:DUF433 domain-containing protein [Azospirillum sp. SYSU D00513]